MKEEQHYFSITRKPAFIERLDSGQYGTIWHRARIDYKNKKTGGIRLCFFAADWKDDFHGDNSFQTTFEDAADILLHRYKGRYLWVKAEFSSEEEDCAFFRRIKVYYPAHSFVRYLPEVYQEQSENEFLIRFTSIFQSIYLDMEEAVTEIASQLDPMASDRLSMLISWLKSEEFKELTPEKQRLFIKKCAGYYKSWGTKNTLCALITWLTGEEPLIIEHFQIKKFITEENRILLEGHYGKTPFDFTVILGRNGMSHDAKESAFLEKVISGMKPAGSNFRLIILSKRLVLDSYTYLGINSILTSYPRPVLDANEALTTFLLSE